LATGLAGFLALAAGLALPLPVLAQEGGAAEKDKPEKKDKPDFPSWKEASEGYEQVVSTADGESLYSLWERKKDGQMLAELPRGWQNQKYLIAMTTPKGELFAGLQSGDRYVYWKRFDKRIALIEPQIDTRTSGDTESKDSVANHFTDRVVTDLPIVCMGPNGQPVIDMDSLLVGNAGLFYGGLASGANTRLATITKAKAFPQNIVVGFEMPVSGGALKTFSYSISVVPENTGYKPRKADERVGYFTTSYRDLGKFKTDEVWTRYINRWNLEKADPKLKMSPPKEPIVFYIEHTVPIRYRRWVKEGVLHWNKAFEQIGIKDAIEVYYQDKATGAHMEKDPEDVRYNFIRWLSNDIGTAVGPHRSHPLTGEILDADIVLTDGWIRHFWYQANEFLPQQAMEGMSPETLAFLDTHPNWDPRVRLADPIDRDRVMSELAMARAQGGPAGATAMDAAVLANPEFQKAIANLPEGAKLCMAANGKAMDMALAGLSMEVLGLLDEVNGDTGPDDGKAEDSNDPTKKPKTATSEKDEGDVIDGIPEWFLGPMLADLTCHEVGHTLGLRHNFKASSIYSLREINSKALKGQKAFAGSVMDYIPVNINMQDGEVQGDYTMIGVGPYDMFAIEYGYTFDDPAKVLKRSSDPQLTYGTDEDTGGPDPLARRYDFSADPRDYAVSRLKLAKLIRSRILDKFVKDGDSWAKARRGYQITLGTQTDAINIMASWLGGDIVNRDHKGDAGDRNPITPVPAAQQRAALKFVIDNAFTDEAFGLTPELLQKMTVQKWSDGDPASNPRTEPTYPIHDRIMGVQSTALTLLLNPTTLRRIYDNEFLVPRDQEALTLPEMMDTVSAAVWSELDGSPDAKSTNREPLISSLRRNLQREHMERLIDLTMDAGPGAASRPIAQLATMKLKEIEGKISKLLDKNSGKLDSYSLAHLTEARIRIQKALDANYIYNASAIGGGGGFDFFGRTTGRPTASVDPAQP
jgi:hypothetical protein